jgi:hypothetical protein
MPLSTDPAFYKDRTIVVDYIAEHYAHDRDDFPREDPAIEVDITERVLNTDIDDVNRFIASYLFLTSSYPNYEIIDNMIPWRIVNGPFRVDNFNEQLLKFFNLDGTTEEEITEEAFAAARQAHGIGEEKMYQVTISRTVTQTLDVQVRADSSMAAEHLARARAGNLYFANGSASDPVYQIESVSVLC